MQCSMGTTPAALIVAAPIVSATTPVARIVDTIPVTNIPTFGMCMSPGNPQVATATAAAQGVLTPQPCLPATGSPWAPPCATVAIGGVPCVPVTSTCQCMWGGVVTVVGPGQELTMGT
jgi:hypothetical protein